MLPKAVAAKYTTEVTVLVLDRMSIVGMARTTTIHRIMIHDRGSVGEIQFRNFVIFSGKNILRYLFFFFFF